MDDLTYEEYIKMEPFAVHMQHLENEYQYETERSDLAYPFRAALGGIEFTCSLVQNLKRLQSDAAFSDVTIKVDGKVFNGHRCVLAAASRYFETMFSSGFQESNAKEIELKDMDGAVFEIIFNFMYSGRMDLFTESNRAIPALNAAAYLGLRNAEKLFTDYFAGALDLDLLFYSDILPIWHAAENHGMHELSATLYPQLLRHFKYAVKTNDFVEKAPFKLIDEYLERENAFVSYGADQNDEQLFRRIIQWLKHDWENRKGDAYKLLQRFRLGLLPKDKVQELMDDQILEIPECKEMMDDLMEKWAEIEGVDDPLKLPESFLPRGMMRTLIAFGGKREIMDDEDESDESSDEKEKELFGHYYDKTNGAWSRLLNPKLPYKSCWELEYPSMVVINRDIYLAGGRQDKGYSDKLYDSKQFSKLDGNSPGNHYSDNYKWTELPQMTHARSRFALVHHDGYLYAIGGIQQIAAENRYLKSVERFNLSTQTWDCIYTLPVPMAYTSAAIVEGKILVYGLKGRVGKEDEFWLVGFDPLTQKWTDIVHERHPVQETEYAWKRNAPDNILVVHDSACYRVTYEEVPSPSRLWLRNYIPHVNHIEMKPVGSGSGGLEACIGREVEGQDTLPDNYARAFHIDRHIYINVCRYAHKTGAILGDPNSKVGDLNGWSRCQSMDKKCVVEYAFDVKNMW
ncbi:kelch-like protein 30 [Amphiura filiformis]|uniref:kelch-like protein 30 n=1 Tax=Amphiura filiformis TaxID=82378 RepID=UPI003B22532D